MTKTNFKAWRLYVKHMLKLNPGKGLKWVLKVYHPKHPKEYQEFKKQFKLTI